MEYVTSTETSDPLTFHVLCCRALRDNSYLHAMEEIYLKPDNPTSSTNHTGKKEVTETGRGLLISLSTLVYFGGFSDSWFSSLSSFQVEGALRGVSV